MLILAPMEDDGKVQIKSANKLITSGDTISIAWLPSSLLQQEITTQDPASLTVNIQLYQFQMTPSGSYIHKQIATLATNVPNSGEATVTIPIQLSVNTIEPVYLVNIMVNVNSQSLQLDSIRSIAQNVRQWSTNFYLIQWSTNLFVRNEKRDPLFVACKGWAASEPASIGPELLERVTQTVPCPPNVGQAEAANSGLVEDKYIDLIAFFHPGADRCFNGKKYHF